MPLVKRNLTRLTLTIVIACSVYVLPRYRMSCEALVLILVLFDTARTPNASLASRYSWIFDTRLKRLRSSRCTYGGTTDGVVSKYIWERSSMVADF